MRRRGTARALIAVASLVRLDAIAAPAFASHVDPTQLDLRMATALR